MHPSPPGPLAARPLKTPSFRAACPAPRSRGALLSNPRGGGGEVRRFHRPAGGGAAGAAEAAAGARARRHGARRRPAGGAAGGGSPLAPFWGLAVVENRHGREARVVWAAEGLLGRAAGLDQASGGAAGRSGSVWEVITVCSFLFTRLQEAGPSATSVRLPRPPRCRALLLVCKLLQEAKAIGDEFLQLEKYVNLNYMGERGASVMWVSAAGCPGPGPAGCGAAARACLPTPPRRARCCAAAPSPPLPARRGHNRGEEARRPQF